jgi:thymidylate synthase (FAD)
MKDQVFPILDHGFIRVLDWMGSDDDILEAARTTHKKTNQVQDDRALLRFLFRHRHSSPFECSVLKLHVKLPIFVERQWARHRTAGWNEISARYCELPEEFYIPEAEDIGEQSKSNRQGRSKQSDEQVAKYFQDSTRAACEDAFDVYHTALDADIARELARIGLPLGTYTEKVWWINLKNLLDFLHLRMDSHAQWEIRQYANVIGEEIVAKLFPWTWEAFLDYRFNAMTLSAQDIKVIQCLLQGGAWPDDVKFGKREYAECQAKLDNLGFTLPKLG